MIIAWEASKICTYLEPIIRNWLFCRSGKCIWQIFSLFQMPLHHVPTKFSHPVSCHFLHSSLFFSSHAKHRYFINSFIPHICAFVCSYSHVFSILSPKSVKQILTFLDSPLMTCLYLIPHVEIATPYLEFIFDYFFSVSISPIKFM